MLQIGMTHSGRGSAQTSLWRAPVAARRICQEHGYPGFYRGVVPAILLCANPAVVFFTYAATSRILTHLRHGYCNHLVQKRFSAVDILLLGAWAKIVASIATYPLQTIKTNLSKAQSVGGTFRGPMEVCRSILICDGLLGLFKGLKGKLLQTSLTAAI